MNEPEQNKTEDLSIPVGNFIATFIAGLVYGAVVHVAFPALTLLQSFVLCYAFVVFVNSLGD